MERTVKRYHNRKLYDTRESRYISLKNIEEMIRAEEEVKVIDNRSGEDITRQILIQVILRMDEEKTGSVEGLRTWINQSGDTVRRAFNRTLEISKEIAGKVEHDIIGRGAENLEVRTGIDWEMMRDQIERFGDWLAALFSDRLRKGLLRIPTTKDWQRISGKLTELEVKINLLAANWEETK
jgi:polyhydroxyalkanoate synthesis repressor PhaR